MKKPALLTVVGTLGVFAVVGYSVRPPQETGTDLQTAWSNLHACLQQDSVQVAAITSHLEEMGRYSLALVEGDSGFQADSQFRELRKLTADFKQLYSEHYVSYSKVLDALTAFRDAADDEVPFDESKVGSCPPR